MLYYDRICVFAGIDYKTRKSKEVDIRHYWHFLDKRLKFQLYGCNGSYDLTILLF